VLYFLLVLFTPVPVAYLLYLGAMAYGVYLQKHYTYHSKWFRWANLTMNFFVNSSIVTKLLSLLGLAAFTRLHELLAALPGLLSNSYYGGVHILLACVIYLGLCVGATALTDDLIRRQVGGQLPPLRLALERAPMTRRKWVPVGLAGLIALFWGLYLPTGDAVLPYFFYTNQQGWYSVLLLLCAAICVVTFNWRGHRGMLLPSLGFVAACSFLTGCLSWDCVYNERNHLVYRSTSLAGSTYRIGQPTWGVWLLLAVFLVCYLLCCRFRVKKGSASVT